MSERSAGFCEEWCESLRGWASGKATVQAVFFYGSRVRGTSSSTSDLDIAIVLAPPDDGEIDAEWSDSCDQWQVELDRALSVKVHLQLYNPVGAGVVDRAIRDHGLLIYRATEN